jgi:hypothetical protein
MKDGGEPVSVGLAGSASERMFEGLHAYIATLPRGLDSHPDHVVKGSLVRGVVSHPAILDARAALPPGLQSLVETPPPLSAWVRETHQAALRVALADLIGAAEMLEFVRRDVRATLASPLYRVLFVFVGPRRVLNAAAARFIQFHRGIGLEAALTDEGGSLRLTPPPGLFTPLVAESFGVSFAVVAQLAGAKDPSFGFELHADGAVEYQLRWR